MKTLILALLLFPFAASAQSLISSGTDDYNRQQQRHYEQQIEQERYARQQAEREADRQRALRAQQYQRDNSVLSGPDYSGTTMR